MKIIVYIWLLLITSLNYGCKSSKLSARIEFNKDNVLIDEVIYWDLIVTNKRPKPVSIFYDPRGFYHNELNRDAALKVELRDSNGNIISKIESKQHEFIISSGRVGYERLLQNNELSFPQWFSDWYAIDKPGKYSLTITKSLLCINSKNERYQTDVTAKEDIYFLPRDKELLNSYIKELQINYKNGEYKDYKTNEYILETIIRSASEVSLEFYDELLNNNNSYISNKIIRALGRLNQSKEAYEILIKHFNQDFSNSIEKKINKVLEKPSLESMRNNALYQIEKFPFELTNEFLLSLLDNDKYSNEMKDRVLQIIKTKHMVETNK